MGVGKFWHDLEIEVFLMGLEVSFPAKFFNASRSLEFFFPTGLGSTRGFVVFSFRFCPLGVEFLGVHGYIQTNRVRIVCRTRQ